MRKMYFKMLLHLQLKVENSSFIKSVNRSCIASEEVNSYFFQLTKCTYILKSRYFMLWNNWDIFYSIWLLCIKKYLISFLVLLCNAFICLILLVLAIRVILHLVKNQFSFGWKSTAQESVLRKLWRHKLLYRWVANVAQQSRVSLIVNSNELFRHKAMVSSKGLIAYKSKWMIKSLKTFIYQTKFTLHFNVDANIPKLLYCYYLEINKSSFLKVDQISCTKNLQISCSYSKEYSELCSLDYLQRYALLHCEHFST